MKNMCKKIIGIILIAILITSTNVALAVTQSDINKQKDEKDKISNQIDEAEEKKKEVEAKKTEAQKQVDSLNSQIDGYEAQIDSLDSQIADADKKIKESEEKLEENKKEYEKKQETLKQRLVVIYESGETSFLDVLLKSSNLTDFISNYYLVSELTEMDTQLIEGLEKQKEEIENSKKEIENSKQQLTEAKASKESVSAELKNAKTEKSKYVEQLSDEEKKIQQEIDEIKNYEKNVSYKLAQMEKEYKEYQQKNQSNNKTNSSNNSNGGSYSGGGTSSYGFGYPVNNHATSNEFGIKKSYYHSSIGHTGLDFTVKEGTPVYAIGDGVITLNYDNPKGWGTNLLIRHEVNGTTIYSFYAHLSSACVTSGWVNKGTLIGYSGNTGTFSQGAHLHFEIRSPGASWDSNCRNPRNYLP